MKFDMVINGHPYTVSAAQTFNEYIYQLSLYPKLSSFPNFSIVQEELSDLLLSIDSEPYAVGTARILEFNKNHSNHFDIFVKRYGKLYLAPLQVLVDHLMRSLGWIIWSENRENETNTNQLLKWYVENFGIQSEPSEMLIIRENMDFAQAYINAENRLMEIVIDLVNFGNPQVSIPLTIPFDWNSKKKAKKIFLNCLRWQFFCIGKESNNFCAYLEAVSLLRNLRNAWTHSQQTQKMKYLKEPDLYSLILMSYHTIILQYEGFYKWYADPGKYPLKTITIR